MGYKKQRFLKKTKAKKNKSKSNKNFKKELYEEEFQRTKTHKRDLIENVKLAEIEEMEAEYV